MTATVTADAGSARRAEIRQAALRLFAQRGYDGTTMREIAAAVNVKAASVYNHFASKEEILWELTASAFADLEEARRAAVSALPPDATARDQLTAFVRAHVSFHAENREQAALVNRQMPGLSPEHYQESVALRDRHQSHLRDIVRAGAGSGEFTLVDERVVTFAILQMGMAVSTWYRPEGELSLDVLCDRYADVAIRIVAP